MPNPPLPDLSVQITRRRPRCVLDPVLALSREGAMLTKRLAPFAEQWVGPEFFNVLDSAPLYHKEPALLVWPGTNPEAIAAVPEALDAWTRLRERSSCDLFWIGDALRESSLSDAVDESVVMRWEIASRTLDRRLPKAVDATGPLIAATRDAAALCAVLPSARVISLSRDGQPPAVCLRLQQWGLGCERLPDNDALVELDRADFLRLLTDAGLGPSIWAGLGLALIYLWLPRASALEVEPSFGADIETDLLDGNDAPAAWVNPWEDGKCFWYEVKRPVA